MKFVADRGKPCPYDMILNSISIATVNYYIPVDFLGGSKPPPYTIRFQLPLGNITRLKAVYHCEAIELAVRRIELKRQLQCNHQINKHKSNSLIPPRPKQGGSETKPL